MPRTRLYGENYYVDLREDNLRGYFEHLDYGDEKGGGLWMERNAEGKLVCYDYDGVLSLPYEVITLLRKLNIDTSEVDV